MPPQRSRWQDWRCSQGGGEVAAAQTSTLPGLPTIWQVAPGDGALTVVWTPPETWGTGTPVGYNLAWYQTSDLGTKVGSEAISDTDGTHYWSHTITGLKNGVAYTINLNAQSTSATGHSSVASGIPHDPLAPSTEKPIWSAMLTVTESAEGAGCQGSAAAACSSALSNDSFFDRGTESTVNELILKPDGELRVKFDARLPTSWVTLRVASAQKHRDFHLVDSNPCKPVAEACDAPDIGSHHWPASGLAWADGDAVEVSLLHTAQLKSPRFIREGMGSATVYARLHASVVASPAEVPITLAVHPSSTAEEGRDFTLVPQIITIEPGNSTSSSARLHPRLDSVTESTETIILTWQWTDRPEGRGRSVTESTETIILTASTTAPGVAVRGTKINLLDSHHSFGIDVYYSSGSSGQADQQTASTRTRTGGVPPRPQTPTDSTRPAQPPTDSTRPAQPPTDDTEEYWIFRRSFLTPPPAGQCLPDGAQYEGDSACYFKPVHPGG
ncbi:fibronectin type III domain-containing protein [Candidatus Poriferisocius sp.]|uniref:fibronectin type III domain-containing protein n=1 Tax=Candidatus Poriferisocius sp. TaxID=3101276 RepID=UPI003B02A0D7